MTAQKPARWNRLIKALEDRGVTVQHVYGDSNVVMFGRTRRTVDHVLRINLDDRVVEVVDEVDRRLDPDVAWQGWAVRIVDDQGVEVLAHEPTRRAGDAADNVLSSLACVLLVDEEAHA